MGLIMLIGLVSACGGSKQNPEGGMDQEAYDNLTDREFPIVNEPITLNMFTAKSDANANVDWNDLPVWNEYEDMTNIELDWTEQASQTGLADKRNIALSTDMPDVFYTSYLPNTELSKYGDQGVFLALNDYIDEHAPNLKKAMEEDPNIQKGMTFPDGNIYSMPAIKGNDFLSSRIGALPWFDSSWLDRLDMDIPETTEEFYQFLTGVKESGDDIIPYGGAGIADLIFLIRGSFGLNNTGVDFIDQDPDGDGLRFVPTSDEYREMLEYVHLLYDEELIDEDIFTFDSEKFIDFASNGIYASTVFSNPESTFGGSGYVSGSALEGPYGDQLYTKVSPALTHNGQFVITSNNPNPVATIRWMDYFYSDEGSRFLSMGIEGETYEAEGDVYKFKDGINRSEYIPGEGLELPGLKKVAYSGTAQTPEEASESIQDIKQYIPDDIWSEFTYTREEIKTLRMEGVDIQKRVKEMRDKFIAGSESLDDDNWNEYVETLHEMGLEKYMDVQNAAYERYISN